jgi:HEAT repeat protein
VEALGAVCKRPKEAVPALIASLQDKDPSVCCWASESLGKFGEQAKDARLPLLTMLSDPVPDNQRTAAMALDKIAPEIVASQVIPVLLRELDNANPRAGEVAAFSLASIPRAPAVVVPALISKLDSADVDLQNQAIYALGEFGAAAEAALPKLKLLSRNKKGNQAYGVDEVISKIVFELHKPAQSKGS